MDCYVALFPLQLIDFFLFDTGAFGPESIEELV
jgi:hypothetical protein